ncbi:tyrosine-type recombinase/integrase [Ideonella sp. YS5]|uniref:tyrosine-type recombinase/integrase n=1 Tax=Ideonella sp. YS5 TaxID=3453714 RepID=UPI003EEBEFF6
MHKDDDPSLGSLLDSYFKVRSLVEASKDRYELAVRNLTNYVSPDRPDPKRVALSAITLDALAGFKQAMLQRATAATYNTEHGHLSTLFNFAVRMEWMPRNELRYIGRAPVPKRAPKSLSRQQVGAYLHLLETASKPGPKGAPTELFHPQWFWGCVLATFFFTGMRMRQLVGLNWSDMDLKAMTITLRAETSKNRREWTIPIPPALAPYLLRLHDRTVEIRGPSLDVFQVFCLPIFSRWRTLFATNVMRSDNVNQFFQRLHKYVARHHGELQRVSAHKLRHSTATILANKVPNLRVVQELLGHTSIKTTYQYVHVELTDMRSALDKL